jgi:hypothetical protein
MLTFWFIGAVVTLLWVLIAIIFNKDVNRSFNAIDWMAGAFVVLLLSICWPLTYIFFLIMAVRIFIDKRKEGSK